MNIEHVKYISLVSTYKKTYATINNCMHDMYVHFVDCANTKYPCHKTPSFYFIKVFLHFAHIPTK